MARLQHLTLFSFAAVHLLFSICPVSSRIYRTNDAVVIEVEDVTPSTLANRNSGIPAPIPMMYGVNPYTGLYYQQQPNFPFWPYPLYRPASSFSDVENVTETLPESRQQTIPCGVGPVKPPKSDFPEERIFGGTQTASWPFMVGLKSTETFGVFCGGSIIAPTKILTAASCVEKLSLKQISTLLVLIGMKSQGDEAANKNPTDPEFTKAVTRVVYHIDYNALTRENDIAILTIDPPIKYSQTVSPVCLPAANAAVDEFADTSAIILGWGNINQAGTRAVNLTYARINIRTNEDCEAAYKKVINFFPKRLCASADGKALCARDVGGPLVAQLNADSTSWTQIGVSSLFTECKAVSSYPSIYTSVASFRKWINTNLMA